MGWWKWGVSNGDFLWIPSRGGERLRLRKDSGTLRVPLTLIYFEVKDYPWNRPTQKTDEEVPMSVGSRECRWSYGDKEELETSVRSKLFGFQNVLDWICCFQRWKMRWLLLPKLFLPWEIKPRSTTFSLTRLPLFRKRRMVCANAWMRERPWQKKGHLECEVGVGHCRTKKIGQKPERIETTTSLNWFSNHPSTQWKSLLAESRNFNVQVRGFFLKVNEATTQSKQHRRQTRRVSDFSAQTTIRLSLSSERFCDTAETSFERDFECELLLSKENGLICKWLGRHDGHINLYVGCEDAFLAN